MDSVVPAAPIYEGSEWDYDKLRLVFDACEVIARDELGLDTYPTQVEVITSEQMLAGLADGSITATPDIIEWRHWINFRDGLAAANRVSRP